MDAKTSKRSKDENSCEVKYCTREFDVKVLGVKLCGKHYEKHCDGKVLETKKGILDFCNGCVVLREG